jgi:hypothetical protein
MRPLAVPLVLIALLAAACSEEDAAGTGASSSPPSAPASPAAANPAAELEAYLAAVKPIALAHRQASGDFSAAVAGISDSPDATWDEAADQVVKLRRDFQGDAAGMDSVPVPAGLEDAQADMVQAETLAVEQLDDVIEILQSHHAAALGQFAAGAGQERLDRINQAQEDWVQAVVERASEAGVRIPRWVRAVALQG